MQNDLKLVQNYIRNYKNRLSLTVPAFLDRRNLNNMDELGVWANLITIISCSFHLV